ncbi:MAG: RsmB/NOP family class I SAM-dependent RNA methyltransferase [Rhodospirillaceae bacterium]|jgi:16S rRNA (cytosine967-C5)-methyltransferase|nr:RsmB/NOP family class I SAM-dependent RNA methyltransferase [Rhodospirillaceae bacterium]MBT5939034.1 RsmB/NOP family class I SAM-dependent RNA methyltransferase [Rhodospirillaceae bacterium]MBT7269050.1 RsmB/NOP family class I SAM-dependent RNA methyltransferase [Rhodospirillaceae bacterium]
MTPGARIAAAIEILEKIDRSGSPAEDVVSAYIRGRRYIGSKDRRAITGRVFDILRRHARLDWLTKSADARARVLVDLALNDVIAKDELSTLFNGEGYAPKPLEEEETTLLDALNNVKFDDAEFPAHIQAELPEWIAEKLQAQWGDNFQAEAQALNQPASLDLRVNTLKGDCARALQVLQKDKIDAEATTLSPLGLRVKGRVNLQASTAFKGGFIEIQDEGSQLVAALVATKADMKTIDLCAGGGGKTLALGAAMKDGGPLIACDTDEDRLKKMKPRLRRGGVSNVTRHPLTGDDDPFYGEHAQTAERVLTDVPCSGSGAWRRAPAQKWRLTPERLDELIALQRKVLDKAADLVIPGGRLIYATCSVLAPENEDQIAWFLESHPDFKALPIAEIWQATLGTDCPSNAIINETYLSLTPARHDTDGFFAAVLEKANS